MVLSMEIIVSTSHHRSMLAAGRPCHRWSVALQQAAPLVHAISSKQATPGFITGDLQQASNTASTCNLRQAVLVSNLLAISNYLAGLRSLSSQNLCRSHVVSLGNLPDGLTTFFSLLCTSVGNTEISNLMMRKT